MRLKETANSNPWAAITAIVALIALLATFGTIYFNSQATQLENEKTELVKPKLVLPDTRLSGGKINEIKFTIFNPSDTEYFYEGGICTPETPSLFELPKPTATPVATTTGGGEAAIPVPQQKTNELIIPPHKEITLYCRNNDVAPVQKDVTTRMEICVNIRGFQSPICREMDITILSS